MEAAKNSVKNILSKSGKHDTTIHENVAPAVQHETINQEEHHREQVAVDKEAHQHHYHTTEQPVAHQETLKEQHHHREAPMQEREFQHGNDDETKRRVAEEQAQYRSTQTRVEGEKTKTSEPVITGEHTHHHVHETIQPVVHKQTVEPHVVHTTVPVHEVHHNESKHHATSALPAVTMDQFQKQGGSLGGRDERSDHFAGEPRNFTGEHGVGGMGLHGHGANARDSETGSSGGYLSNDSNQAGRDTDRTGQSGMRDTMRSSDNSTNNGSSQSKPSMMDKLNPKKDADGDGQAGFMK